MESIEIYQPECFFNLPRCSRSSPTFHLPPSPPSSYDSIENTTASVAVAALGHTMGRAREEDEDDREEQMAPEALFHDEKSATPRPTSGSASP